MKAFYDKIILAVGVLALAGGAAFYFTQGGGKASGSAGLAGQAPSGAAYEPIPAPQLKTVASQWGDPIPQDADGLEVYDVFTPPKIYWKPPSFVFEPWEPPVGKVPFGMDLLVIDRELYRIQMEAYFEATTGLDKDAKIQFYDYQTDTSFRGTVGESFDEHEVEILAFEVEREVNPNGTIRRVPRVRIKDQDSGQEIELTTDERLYIPGKFDLRMATKRPYPAEQFVWQAVGDHRQVADATFTLLDFDFDSQSAKLEKTSPDTDPETETLYATALKSSANAASPEPASTEKEPEETIPGGFDELFNN